MIIQVKTNMYLIETMEIRKKHKNQKVLNKVPKIKITAEETVNFGHQNNIGNVKP